MVSLARAVRAGAGAASLLLLLTVVAMPGASLAEPRDAGACLIYDTHRAVAALTPSPLPEDRPRREATPVTGRLTQSRLCCCTGFDGRECCAQARSCDVSPPGCFCRRQR